MIFRRNRRTDESAKESPDESPDEMIERADQSDQAEGPYDADEVTLPTDDQRLDLGSLLLRGLEGYELLLPV
ncbi:MAG: hypothetical protein ACRDPI_02680, partial [Nocardioidaceae bacterium]